MNSWKHISFLGKKLYIVARMASFLPHFYINLLAISEEDMPHKKEKKKAAESNKEYFFKHSTAQNESKVLYHLSGVVRSK